MSPAAAEAAQTVSMADVKTVFWILGLIGSVGTAIAVIITRANSQLSSTRAQLYGKINKDKAESEKKLKEITALAQDSKEKVSLLELANKHQESRLDGLDEKIDNVQKEITDTKDKVTAINLKMSENQLALVGEVRSIGDKFSNEISKIQIQQVTKEK